MTANITYTGTEIVAIAKCQKRANRLIVWAYIACFLVGFLSACLPQISSLIIALLQITIAIFAAAAIYDLAVALKASNPWIWALVIIIPCGGLLALLILSIRATRALKTRGVRVGLMGAIDGLKKITDSVAGENSKITTAELNELEFNSSEMQTWAGAVIIGAHIFNSLQQSLNIFPSREYWESEFLRQNPQELVTQSVMDELWKDSEAAGREFNQLCGKKSMEDVVKEILHQRASESRISQ